MVIWCDLFISTVWVQVREALPIGSMDDALTETIYIYIYIVYHLISVSAYHVCKQCETHGWYRFCRQLSIHILFSTFIISVAGTPQKLYKPETQTKKKHRHFPSQRVYISSLLRRLRRGRSKDSATSGDQSLHTEVSIILAGRHLWGLGICVVRWADLVKMETTCTVILQILV